MSNKKVVLFAFEGEKMCFMHVLLNAMDMHKNDIDVKIVMEGAATKLLKELIEEGNNLLKQVMDLKLIDSICEACSNQMGVLEYNKGLGIPINGEMNGHPSMTPYIKDGYDIIVM